MVYATSSTRATLYQHSLYIYICMYAYVCMYTYIHVYIV